MFSRMRILLAAVVAACAPVAGARVIEVRPVPAREVIGAALAGAQPGDVVRLAAGIYQEHVRMRDGVSVSSEDGAVIDPSEALDGDWRQAAEIGPGVWKTAAAEEVHGLLIDGKLVAALAEPRASKDGAWHWKTLLVSGPPLSGFRQIRGLWMWKKDERALYLSLGGGDPRGHQWHQLRRSEAAVTFHGVKQARLQGITLAGAHTGVRFSGGSRDCEMRGCRILSFEKCGVEITGGSSACRVVGNSITRGSWESWAPRTRHGPGSKEEYEVWQIHKRVGFYDRVGVNLFRAGSDNRILSNELVETFDGIDVGDYAVESLAKPLPHPEHGRGTEIGWNRLRDVRDSGIEIGGGAIDVRAHHNHLLRVHGGIRFKVPRVGPVFIDHNWLEDDRGFNIWFSMDSSPAEGYIYQNTITGDSPALVYSSMEKGFADSGTPRWHFINNLVVTKGGLFGNRSRGALRPNFTAIHNVVAGGGRPWPDEPQRERGSLYLEALELGAQMRLPAGSPAAGVALDLSHYRDGQPLPGWVPGEAVGAGPRRRERQEETSRPSHP
jgi:hypothetical protein